MIVRSPHRSLLVATLSAAFAGTPAAHAQTPPAPDPSHVYIRSVKATGNGCRPQAWASSVTTDGKAFSIVFSGFALSLPSPRPQTLNCKVDLDLAIPANQTVAVRAFAFRSNVYLEQGVRAVHSVTYGWQGRPGTVAEGLSIVNGPHDGTHLFTDDVSARSAELDFRPCDGQSRLLELRMNTSLSSTRPDGVGFVNIPALDGDLTQDTGSVGGRVFFAVAQRACK